MYCSIFDNDDSFSYFRNAEGNYVRVWLDLFDFFFPVYSSQIDNSLTFEASLQKDNCFVFFVTTILLVYVGHMFSL